MRGLFALVLVFMCSLASAGQATGTAEKNALYAHPSPCLLYTSDAADE